MTGERILYVQYNSCNPALPLFQNFSFFFVPEPPDSESANKPKWKTERKQPMGILRKAIVSDFIIMDLFSSGNPECLKIRQVRPWITGIVLYS